MAANMDTMKRMSGGCSSGNNGGMKRIRRRARRPIKREVICMRVGAGRRAGPEGRAGEGSPPFYILAANSAVEGGAMSGRLGKQAERGGEERHS